MHSSKPGICIAQKHGREGLVDTFDWLWLGLIFPLVVVFENYLLLGNESWLTHAPYILSEYATLFSIISIAININRTWAGWSEPAFGYRWAA
ncbi:MAG: hypothetical protein DWQ07_01430 [Chloroflexi bacterium]|nr:MAG: hypothetical protein DWQ07_01430 [Chloroflexota bacterium]MBL1193842.1 hypothetical protein [Chloroflexota bacterium]NOH11136.1 hypothetical protein [Chloroflexota bacterium]